MVDEKKIYEDVKKSRLVNGKWYLEEYPDVKVSGMDPIIHYLKYGWQLGRKPCKHFDVSYYIRSSGISETENPLLHYIYNGIKYNLPISEKHEKKESSTSKLSRRLWGGHSAKALEGLHNLIETSKGTERWLAAWHASRWYFFVGNYDQAYFLASSFAGEPKDYRGKKKLAYVKAFCELKRGEVNKARETLEQLLHLNPNDLDIFFALSNTFNSLKEKVDILNKAYKNKKMSLLKAEENLTKPSFKSLAGNKDFEIKNGKNVSIIIPAFNAEENIEIAVRSLQNQTYSNLEIIVVDDCSTDQTLEVVNSIKENDSRVVALKTPFNGGAYAARNFGLKHATGDFITTHDSDDWSHPQKIQMQVSHLENNSSVMGCCVHWVRAEEDLKFTQNWRPVDCLIHWSQSSFMFRRKVMQDIGVWDNVRVGGDTEYIWRMQAYYGVESLSKIEPEIPLAFALDEETSLTRTKSTHVSTVYFGLRHLYRYASDWWHKSGKEKFISYGTSKRPFPSPKSMYSKDSEDIKLDILVAGDFAEKESCKSLEKIAANKGGKKIGAFHWPKFNKGEDCISFNFFEVLHSYNVEPIVVGQKVTAKKYIILDLSLVNDELDFYPEMLGFEKWECSLSLNS